MNRFKFLILISIFFFFVDNSYSQDSALRLDIKPEKITVRNGGAVSVMTKIINPGRIVQHLQIWSCSYYDNWIVDNPFVKLEAWPCNKNFFEAVTLKPGEDYANRLSLKITVPAEEILVEKLVFKLGFKRSADEQTSVIWSRPIKMEIKENIH